MLVDMHAHFPMHLLVDDEQRTHERARTWWRQRWQGRLVDLISRFANYQGPGDTPSVNEKLMRDGGVGVALSVLYQPFSEIDLTESYGAPPRQSYFKAICDQHQTVEDYVVRPHRRGRDRSHRQRARRVARGRGPDPDPRDRRRLPARARSGRGAQQRADAGRYGGRVRDGRAPVLPRRRDERPGAAVPAGPRLQLRVPPGQDSRPHRAGTRGHRRDGRRGNPDRHHPHAHAVDPGRVRAARRARSGEGDPGDRHPHGLPLRRSGVFVRRRHDQGRGARAAGCSAASCASTT